MALPYLFFLTCKQKYRHSIPARFFLWKNFPFKKANIWLHGCSYGEIKSLKPLIEKLNTSFEVSAITQTGYEYAQKEYKNARYLPFEIWLPFWIQKPKALMVTEAELWLLLFATVHFKGAKTFLINARISDASFNKYKKLKFFYKFLFSFVDLVFAQSETDKERLLYLGARNITVNGNIKTAMIPQITHSYNKPNKKIITLASSHEGEEELLLKEFKNIKNCMLIIAPRHPERFEKVYDIALAFSKKHSLTCKKFSQSGFSECDILVCDTLGELINIYAITDITLLCGSFIDGYGGHNPLESAYFKNVIISGKYIYNQKELYAQVANIYTCEASQVSDLLKKPLTQATLHAKDSLSPIIKELEKL